MTTHNRVIVIGSGVSGLACARELVHRGYEVLVVEARSRVGGRLKGEPITLADGEHPVDLGGALIHGIEDNPVHSITTQMGVPLHEISDYCLLLDENGWPFDAKEDEKLSTMFNECLDVTFQRASQDPHSAGTFGDLFDQVCKEKGVKNNHPLLKWHQANLELPTGAGFHDLGYTWNDDEPYGFGGAHAAVETSWRFVMEHLAHGLDILYNSPVSRIQVVLPDGTTPAEYPEPPPTIPKSPDGNDMQEQQQQQQQQREEEEEEDDEEEQPIKIITCTEWRRAKKPPPISPSRRSRRIRGEDVSVRRSDRSTKGIIQKLTVGHEKAIFSYDNPSKKPPSTHRKRKKTDGELTTPYSTVQVTLQNGRVLEADAVVCTLPLGILKIPSTNPGQVKFVPPLPPAKQLAFQQLGCGLLNKCIISFSEVFWQDSEFLGLAEKDHAYLVLNAVKYTGKPILIFMYGGSFAKEIEAWTDAAIVEDCLRVLKRICGKEIPFPLDYCVTRWGEEEFSRMAFTYIPPGVDGQAQLAAAGEPIYDPALLNKPLIMFAGEHTTPYHPSTMHGAFLSGIREAYRYDIFVAPELNGNMEFETDHKIYEYTFTTKRVFRGPRVLSKPEEPSATTNSRSSQIRSRRLRFANMALRKDPAKRVFSDTKTIAASPSKKKPDTKTTDSVGSRRSQRSASSRRVPVPAESMELIESTTPEAQEKHKSVDDLQNRSLSRAAESYGRYNSGLVMSKIVPVFGSSRKPSAQQMRQRMQRRDTSKRQSETLLKQWEAKTVASLVPNSKIEMTRSNGDNGTTERRKSSRPSRPKRPGDY